MRIKNGEHQRRRQEAIGTVTEWTNSFPKQTPEVSSQTPPFSRKTVFCDQRNLKLIETVKAAAEKNASLVRVSEVKRKHSHCEFSRTEGEEIDKLIEFLKASCN